MHRFTRTGTRPLQITAVPGCRSRFTSVASRLPKCLRQALLDATVGDPDLVWLGTANVNAAHLLALTRIEQADLPHVSVAEGEPCTARLFPDRLPLGIHLVGRLRRHRPWLDELRVFLLHHGRTSVRWTLRVQAMMTCRPPCKGSGPTEDDFPQKDGYRDRRDDAQRPDPHSHRSWHARTCRLGFPFPAYASPIVLVANRHLRDVLDAKR